ncbi:MAG TPA: HD domain-containing protein [Candidatus Nanoarchaeia archaeon]|nr:HD domain-containing protein [Candidatus Nanoarchaeia archaeon]
MESEKLIKLAKKYCKYYHKGQTRKRDGSPFYRHPFRVAEILKKYKYSDYITQCIALLHDVVEDCEVRIREIHEIFGFEIANGVYILSKNTIKNYTKESLDCSMIMDISNFSDDDLYKMRIAFARRKIKRVKIADMIHNTIDLDTLSEKTIKRKIKNAKEFYIPMGKKIAPEMVKELEKNIQNYTKNN